MRRPQCNCGTTTVDEKGQDVHYEDCALIVYLLIQDTMSEPDTPAHLCGQADGTTRPCTEKHERAWGA